MSVLACGRYDCPNVMCDYMVDGRYICNDCMQELEDWRKSWPDSIEVADVQKLIEEFMNTGVGQLRNSSRDPDDVEQEWQRLKPRKQHED